MVWELPNPKPQGGAHRPENLKPQTQVRSEELREAEARWQGVPARLTRSLPSALREAAGTVEATLEALKKAWDLGRKGMAKA